MRRLPATFRIRDLARDRGAFVNIERFERDRKVDDVENYIVRPELRDNNSFATFRRFVVRRQLPERHFRSAPPGDPRFPSAWQRKQPANCDPGAVKISGICRWDLPANQDIVPESTRQRVCRATIDFTATLQGFAEVGYNCINALSATRRCLASGAWYSRHLRSVW